MRVFITQKQLLDKHQQTVDGLETGYIRYFLEKKIFPSDTVFVPVVNHLAHCQRLTTELKPDFIILTGSNDVMPPQGAQIPPGEYAPDRDAVERYLINYCDEFQIPKLAICRGFQFLNVHYQGQLDYHLSGHLANEDKSQTCLYDNKPFTINSYHQHGVKLSDLSTQLFPLVTSVPDNLVEGYMQASNAISPTLGVQWHPERKPISEDLFERLFKKVMYESGVISSRHG